MLDPDVINIARNVYSNVIPYLLKLESLMTVSQEFEKTVNLLSTQRIWVIGVGKAGLCAHKLSANLACNGRPAAYIHAAEALHGDFGAIQTGDVVVACSNSGRTDEVIQVASKVKEIGAILILITSNEDSQIDADIILCYGKVKEACPLGLTPTTSILVMMALCDSLSMAVQKIVGLTYDTYAINHHSGYLGDIARLKSRR